MGNLQKITFEGDIRYPEQNTWTLQQHSDLERLIISPSDNNVNILLELSQCLPEPFGILYILLVPRVTENTGRFQNPSPSNRDEMESFILHFSEFIEKDGRHELWLISLPISATLVYDRHNVIYAYGPISDFIDILKKKGFTEGKFESIPTHTHYYHSEFDKKELELMSYWDWIYFPLKESDNNS